jgi:amino acid transporter
VFFAVFGYDAMSTAAEEAQDGKKHMPKAIMLSLIIYFAYGRKHSLLSSDSPLH